MAAKSCDVLTDLVYLKRDERHEHEKPYRLQYEPEEGLPRSNFEIERRKSIQIHDMRGKEDVFTMESNGFEILHLDSKMLPEDFDNEERVKTIYYDELRTLLRKHFKARRVEILEHGIRKRHPMFPISTGKDYEHQQPTSVVHVDFTLDSSLAISRRVFNADSLCYGGIQTINVWKPLQGPVTDWPLAVCDVSSVDRERDYVASDVVARPGFTENLQVYYNVSHKWFYLSKQLASEVIVFRQADTRPEFAIGVPHASFYNPQADVNEVPRESVEARAFIYY